MSVRASCVVLALAWCVVSPDQTSAEKPDAVYRVLDGRQACLPCGATPHYVVIGSAQEVSDLHARLVEKCGGSREPDRWRQFVLGLGLDFRDEAVVTMYEVIGTGGSPSLEISGPEEGALKARIKWQTGPPPHPPIATAACMTFAVQKAAVRRVDIQPGGVLNKNRGELALVVPTGGVD